MASQRLKKFHWLIIVGLLSVAVGCVIAVLFFLLLTFPASVSQSPPRSPASEAQPTLPPSTETLATPAPVVQFEAQEPITGYSDCESYGVYGTITTNQGEPLSVQVTLWQHPDGGLLAISPTDAEGRYRITRPGSPENSNLRVQLYRRDRPVSEPLLIKIYFDCQNGFQIYEVDWRQKG